MKRFTTILTVLFFFICSLASAENQVRWTSTGPGGGSFLMASAIQPDNEDIIYVGGDIEGVFKTVEKSLSLRMV
ncbi:hypothetical protein ACFL60_09755 [Candidatus Omnitrophota bacterium]